jgi:hypothetical protein
MSDEPGDRHAPPALAERDAPTPGARAAQGEEPSPPSARADEAVALVNAPLSLAAFRRLAGVVSGVPYVKLLVDRQTEALHFIADAAYRFHSDYVAERILGIPRGELDLRIDEWNRESYASPARRFLIGTLGLHEREGRRFFTVETAEIDDMGPPLVEALYARTRALVDPALPLFWKPANHTQELAAEALDRARVPRILARELEGDRDFVPLCPGVAEGRLRAFRSEADFRRAVSTLERRDVLVMPRVPDDAPRAAGFLSAEPVTPLSHVNVLAHGWGIPNAVQRGALEDVEARGLDGRWVRYVVDADATRVSLEPLARPPDAAPGAARSRVRVSQPVLGDAAPVALSSLRASARERVGTKAANLGELMHLLAHGSPLLLGYYRVPRPPRATLLPHLAERLGLPRAADERALLARAERFLGEGFRVPRGLALPFGAAELALTRCPAALRALGRLSLALELELRELDAVCVEVVRALGQLRLPDEVCEGIERGLAEHLPGVTTVVVRSSSNAEDLPGFSAAGIYDSKTHVTTREGVFDAVRAVWASLYSPRAVRLRHEAGIGLDEARMGVVIEEEIAMPEGSMGGVLVTANPLAERDFRHVYVNVSRRSVEGVVGGRELPQQYLFNTVEGGGRTLSLGAAGRELDEPLYQALEALALAGRLLEPCFAPDLAGSTPLDVEWIHAAGTTWLLQARPYGSAP